MILQFVILIIGEVMKSIINIFFMIILVICVYIFKDNISTFINDSVVYKTSNNTLTYNEYFINNDYLYVQNIYTDKVINRQELLNMLYTIINSGDEKFTFKCSYEACINDVKEIINNSEIITSINNYVHPYNSFLSVNIDVSESGNITLTPNRIYKENEIIEINKYIDNFILNNINNEMSDYDKIKAFHDYVINNTIYDNSGSKEFFTAYKLITEGKAICGGYSDIISIYLNKLGIKNYKISSYNHVWNLVYVNDSWLHLDATWDDPVASDGNQYLLYNFFLINTEDLLNLDTVEHEFNKDIYLEAK